MQFYSASLEASVLKGTGSRDIFLKRTELGHRRGATDF
jgi:hypothetical protein